MRFTAAFSVLVLYTAALAQSPPKLSSPLKPKPVTVPFTLDHDRIIVEVNVALSNRTTQHVHAWLDNGNPDLHLSHRLALLTGRTTISCDGQLCSTTPPVEMSIGGMTIPLGGRIPGAGIKEAWVSSIDNAPLAPGMSAEINIPSTVLSHYDVLIDFPGRELTIGQPGTLKFKGVTAKVIVNPANGLIEVPGKIENKKYSLALDLGQSISLLTEELVDKLATAHPDWPRMTGAIGPANVSGSADELKRKLMRVDRLQYGPLFLTNVVVAEFLSGQPVPFAGRPGGPSNGLLGSEALLNYRVGIDYAHSTVYFDIGRLFDVPDFDVVGLILRPENDGQFTILGVADYEGKPSVPEGNDGVQAGDHLIAVDGIPVRGSTLGQVWAMLAGSPGTKRMLTVERAGGQVTVGAQVQHFLGDAPLESQTKKRSKKKN
ncbi:MAG: PDZ domain-containing protein [Candidatus Sulfotelmatobacter sp.]